ncbi:MAG: hypothetical protein JNJ48_00705 [Phycisphaerae bacterium]|nr:hypothetical protein [Phycisphaerae bacterium]
MTSSRLGTAGWAVTLGSALLFLVSGVAMALRIRDYHDASPPPQFYFKAATDRSFDVDGVPVSITDEKTADGRAAVRIRYGPDEAIVPVIAPPIEKFKDLTGYEESLRVLAFAPMVAGRVQAEIDGKPAVRLVIVVRHPAVERENDPSALVGSKLWTFELIELVRGATPRLARRTMQFRDRRGELPALKADGAAGVLPIEERTWEWQAALWAMPKLYASRYKYKSDAVDGMGWTLPGAGFSMLGVIVGAALLMAHKAERPRAAPAA